MSPRVASNYGRYFESWSERGREQERKRERKRKVMPQANLCGSFCIVLLLLMIQFPISGPVWLDRQKEKRLIQCHLKRGNQNLPNEKVPNGIKVRVLTGIQWVCLNAFPTQYKFSPHAYKKFLQASLPPSVCTSWRRDYGLRKKMGEGNTAVESNPAAWLVSCSAVGQLMGFSDIKFTNSILKMAKFFHTWHNCHHCIILSFYSVIGIMPYIYLYTHITQIFHPIADKCGIISTSRSHFFMQHH